MPTPGEHKTVQARILQYAQEMGWKFVPHVEAERRWKDGGGSADKIVRAPLIS